jgi:hypothetical protein
VVTAAMGKAVAVEVMLTVEGVGVVVVVVVVDIAAAVREEAAVEVMVAAEGMAIVEVEETFDSSSNLMESFSILSLDFSMLNIFKDTRRSGRMIVCPQRVDFIHLFGIAVGWHGGCNPKGCI